MHVQLLRVVRAPAFAYSLGQQERPTTLIDTRQLGDPGTPAFQVEKYPFYLLNRLVARYNSIIEERLRAIGLDIPYWRVLMILGQQSPLSIRDIAGAAVINLSTMTRIVQRMTAVGLVDCRTRPEDNRVTEVSLTPSGEEKLAAARAATAPVYHKVIGGVGRSEFDQIIETLNRFHTNLEELEPPRRRPKKATAD